MVFSLLLFPFAVYYGVLLKQITACTAWMFDIPLICFYSQELKNNKIEEDLDRGLSGGVGGLGVMSSHSSLTSGYQSSLGGHSGPSSLGSLQPSLQPPHR